jgi:hypothetical protein
MFKKAIRLGVLVMMVAAFMFVPLGSKPAHAGVAIPTWEVSADIFSQHWDGNTNYMEILDRLTPVDFIDRDDLSPDMTIGEFRSMVESEVGHPVTILGVLTEGYCGPEDAYVVPTSDSAAIGSYQTCEGDPWSYFLIFNNTHKMEVPRLTLYGYVSGNNHTCVLWSINGALPNNVNKTCGMDVKLVCTVKLIEKKLDYDCKSGYDWLGKQILNDPQWLSWADKFASMNGHK